MDLVTIARIFRPRGIKGEVAALPLSANPERTGRVFINNAEYEVENVWLHGDSVIFKFRGIDSISQAEPLSGAEISIPLEERPSLEEGEFYQSDLIGCTVETRDGKTIGIIEAWQEFGGPPLLQINADARELLIPFVKSICVEIDPSHKRVVIDPPEGLLDL